MLIKIHERIGINERDIHHEKCEAMLQNLFPIQLNLDQYVIKKRGLHDIDLFQGKMVALKTELFEAVNEWRGFKHWSDNQKPKEGLLEELSDTFHFILSVGLEKGIHRKKRYYRTPDKELKVSGEHSAMSIIEMTDRLINEYWSEKTYKAWYAMFHQFMELVFSFGFQIEHLYDAYMDKNKVNFDRQNNGY